VAVIICVYAFTLYTAEILSEV